MMPLLRITCERAWALMQDGRGLHAAARELGVSARELDRSIWEWRASVAPFKPNRKAA